MTKTQARVLSEASKLPALAFTESARAYFSLSGPHLAERSSPLSQWYRDRISERIWPYSRTTLSAPSTSCEIVDEQGQQYTGVNFASQDYLSLSSHPRVKEAAIKAIESHGVHSAGSAMLMGNTHYSLNLQEMLAEFLKATDVVLFPTGWGAGFGSIQALVRENDHIIIDGLAHGCLKEGAKAATKNIRLFSHLNNDHVRRLLQKIRATDTANLILVVTEGLFSMHADVPDLRGLQAICSEYDATLLVDVAHDLACLGPDGTGVLGMQDMLGSVDIVMGSFSKTFASNGGFVAVRDRRIRDYLKVFSSSALLSNALSPAQSAVISTALDIVRSGEGELLRNALMTAAETVRGALREANFEVNGVPGPIVPVPIGSEALARLLSRYLPENGVIANLAEYPVVAKGDARVRLQIMARHSGDDIRRLVTGLKQALEMATEAHRKITKSGAALESPHMT